MGTGHVAPAHGARFLFVTCGSFSGSNASVLARLEAEFPQLEADEVDIPTVVRRRRLVIAVNLLFVLFEWGPGALLDRRRLWGAFFRTSFMFRWVRRFCTRRCAGGDYAFGFQTQSLFDASVPGLPHFVYTDHTELVNRTYPDYDPTEAPPAAWLERERRIYKRATTTFTWSRHVTSSLLEEYGIDPGRVEMVGGGANVAAPAELGAEREPARVLFVGRDWERKGGPDLLAAFALLRRRNPAARLTIAGCEPDVAADGIEVVGEIPAAEVSRRLGSAAVFCMPTLREPFGIAFVEALAHGLPVVGTAIGAVPDVVDDGETGFLVAPHDIEAIATALERLLADPDLRTRFGELGRERVRERFSWPAVIARMAASMRSRIAPGDALED